MPAALKPGYWPEWPTAKNRFLLFDKVTRENKWKKVKPEWLMLAMLGEFYNNSGKREAVVTNVALLRLWRKLPD